MAKRVHLHILHTATLVLFLISCYFCVQGDGVEKRTTAVVAVATDNAEEIDGVDVSVEEDVDDDDENPEVFVPTAEWQHIKAGQAIPAGLHIQMNLQTGVKMAKLMDGDDGERYRKPKEQGVQGVKASATDDRYSHQELKDALKKFKANQDDVKSPEEIDKIKRKFRSIEELKKDFADMQLNVETDVEIMIKLIKRYQEDGASTEEKEAVLYNLEYYAHQIDNGQDLITIGGLDLITQALNDTKDVIRKQAAFVLGSAAQSNPKVQVAAIDRGAIQTLLRLISPSQPVAVRKKAMYAISSLVRHFPIAQVKFLQLGGLDSFLGLFKETKEGTLQLQVKAVTLLHDLLLEQKVIFEGANAKDEVKQHKIQQYQEVQLLPEMMKQGWCEIIPSLLESPEHDTREKVLLAMQLLLDECQMNYYKDKRLIGRLSELKNEYEKHAHEEQVESGGTEDYFSHLSHLVADIMVQLALSP